MEADKTKPRCFGPRAPFLQQAQASPLETDLWGGCQAVKISLQSPIPFWAHPVDAHFRSLVHLVQKRLACVLLLEKEENNTGFRRGLSWHIASRGRYKPVRRRFGLLGFGGHHPVAF